VDPSDQPADVGGAPAAANIAPLDAVDRPTAFVVPDVRVAATFCTAMAERGIALSPRDVAISGIERLLPVYRMTEHRGPVTITSSSPPSRCGRSASYVPRRCRA
jgi:DNA-binding LacI/PurR family transcriptional regulator